MSELCEFHRVSSRAASGAADSCLPEDKQKRLLLHVRSARRRKTAAACCRAGAVALLSCWPAGRLTVRKSGRAVAHGGRRLVDS